MCYRDSVMALGNGNEDFLKQVDVFLQIRKMNRESIIDLIDSLFEADRIPYPLINQINYYVAHHDFAADERPLDLWIDPDGGIYFSDPYYQRKWWKHTEMPQDCQCVYYLSPDRHEDPALTRTAGSRARCARPTPSISTGPGAARMAKSRACCPAASRSSRWTKTPIRTAAFRACRVR